MAFDPAYIRSITKVAPTTWRVEFDYNIEDSQRMRVVATNGPLTVATPIVPQVWRPIDNADAFTLDDPDKGVLDEDVLGDSWSGAIDVLLPSSGQWTAVVQTMRTETEVAASSEPVTFGTWHGASVKDLAVGVWIETIDRIWRYEVACLVTQLEINRGTDEVETALSSVCGQAGDLMIAMKDPAHFWHSDEVRVAAGQAPVGVREGCLVYVDFGLTTTYGDVNGRGMHYWLPGTPDPGGGQARPSDPLPAAVPGGAKPAPGTPFPPLITYPGRRQFTGRITSFENWKNDAGEPMVTIRAEDAIGDLQRVVIGDKQTDAKVGDGENARQRMTRLFDAVGARHRLEHRLANTPMGFDFNLAAHTPFGSVWNLASEAAADSLAFLSVKGDGAITYFGGQTAHLPFHEWELTDFVQWQGTTTTTPSVIYHEATLVTDRAFILNDVYGSIKDQAGYEYRNRVQASIDTYGPRRAERELGFQLGDGLNQGMLALTKWVNRVLGDRSAMSGNVGHVRLTEVVMFVGDHPWAQPNGALIDIFDQVTIERTIPEWKARIRFKAIVIGYRAFMEPDTGTAEVRLALWPVYCQALPFLGGVS